MLSFFYDSEQSTWGFNPDDRGSATVFWFPELGELRRRELPDNLPSRGRFASRSVRFIPEWTVPDWPHFDAEPAVQARQVPIDADFDALARIKTQLAGTAGTRTCHRLGGHPETVQGEMLDELALVDHGIYMGGLTEPKARSKVNLRAEAKRWRLLLQVDSDDDLGTMWGDVGRIYFWIRDDHLADRSFDRSWLILQCT